MRTWTPCPACWPGDYWEPASPCGECEQRIADLVAVDEAEERACAAESAWEARRDDKMIEALERAENEEGLR